MIETDINTLQVTRCLCRRPRLTACLRVLHQRFTFTRWEVTRWSEAHPMFTRWRLGATMEPWARYTRGSGESWTGAASETPPGKLRQL